MNSDSQLRKHLAEQRALAFVDYDNCMLCGIAPGYSKMRGPVWLEIHHILARFGHVTKWERASNCLMLCNRCHRHYHGNTERGDDGARLPRLEAEHMLW